MSRIMELRAAFLAGAKHGQDVIARLAAANEARTPGEKCEPRYGSCALLAGHRGPHHGYPEDVAALRWWQSVRFRYKTRVRARKN